MEVTSAMNPRVVGKDRLLMTDTERKLDKLIREVKPDADEWRKAA